MAINVTMTAVLLVLAVAVSLWMFAQDFKAVVSIYGSLSEAEQRRLARFARSAFLLFALIPLVSWGLGKVVSGLKRRRG